MLSEQGYILDNNLPRLLSSKPRSGLMKRVAKKNITLKMKELVYLYIYKLLSTNRTTTVAANQRACSEGSLGVAKLVIFCSKLKQSFPVASPTENFLARQNSFPDLNSSLIFIPLNFASPQAANHLSQKPPHTVKRSLS